MPLTYFFLGNTPELSLLELTSLFDTTFNTVNNNSAIVASEIALLDPKTLNKLGGTTKVALEVARGSKDHLKALLTQVLSTIPNKNIAITDYAKSQLTKTDLFELKSQLKRPVRFVSMETNEHELVMLARQHVGELNIIPDQDGLVIALTNWIFDAKDWVVRDRQKPYRDIKRGMLPPKLARILVNLATRGDNISLFDPFCGTGTVLTEALLSGIGNVYGSDNNAQAIDGAKGNLEWTIQKYELENTQFDIQVRDATHPVFTSVGAIATEPYMGPLLNERNPLDLDKIKDIAKGLDKLYRGSLKAWLDLLPAKGRVVMTIPSFAVYGHLVPTLKLDSINPLGYNYIASVAYGKPGATVIRNVTILEKK